MFIYLRLETEWEQGYSWFYQKLPLFFPDVKDFPLSSWQHSVYCRPNFYCKELHLLLRMNNILQIKTCNSFNSNTFGWGLGINYVNLKANFYNFQEILIRTLENSIKYILLLIILLLSIKRVGKSQEIWKVFFTGIWKAFLIKDL